MDHTNEQLATVNLEPLGGREVTVDELGQTAGKIVDIIRGLGKKQVSESSGKEDSGSANAAGPDVNYDELKKYAIYGVSGIAGIYLIGKALQ